MSVIHECLCIGLDPAALQVSRPLAGRGLSLVMSAAAEPGAVADALKQRLRWDLLLCDASAFYRVGMDRWLGGAGAMPASLVLIKPVTSQLSPAEAWRRGAADVVTAGDREHLLMVIERELQRATERRILAAPRPGDVPPPLVLPQIADLGGRGDQPAGAADDGQIKALIEGGGLMLAYQPIVTLRRERDQRAMFEALIRLRDGRGGVLLPDTFLPVAGRHAWLGRLDLWVVRRALPLLERMQSSADTDMRLFLNLSTETLADGGVLDAVIGAIQSARVRDGSLVIEVHKEVFFTQPLALERLVQVLRLRGHGLLVERLEAGEAGLLKAHAKTISHAKLDPALVRAAASDESARDDLVALTRAARDCDVQIIALAVDSAEVLPILCAAGVDHVQGHLVSTPHEQLVYPGFQQVEPAVTETGADADADIDPDAGADAVEAASDR